MYKLNLQGVNVRNLIQLGGKGDLGTSNVNMKSSAWWLELEITMLREIRQTQANSMFVMCKNAYLNSRAHTYTHIYPHAYDRKVQGGL